MNTNLIDKTYDWLHAHCPKLLISIRMSRICHEYMRWQNPKTINAKINWLKFHADLSLWARLSDKYAVRSFVAERGFENNLVKLYGHWSNVDEIDWDALPQSFILKANNGSGDSYVVNDKNTISKTEIAEIFNPLMTKVYRTTRYEPHYALIKPCIIAEELLDAKKQAYPSSSLIDYKIWCFDGKPYAIWACANRTKHTVDVGTYDLDWNFHPEYSNSTDHYRLMSQPMPRPKKLDEMLAIAAKLSDGFPQVRVDMYEVNDHVYFGEMTFTSNGGMMDFYTYKYALQLGEQIVL